MQIAMIANAPVREALRPLRLAMVVALCVATVALSAGASPAGAIITTIAGHGYGVTPIRGVNPTGIAGAYRAPGSGAGSGEASALSFDELPNGGGPLIDNGGPVMHSNTTHVIYWDPNGEFTATTKGIVAKFLTDVAHDSGVASNVFAVDAQYGAAYSSTYAGESTDTDPYPSSGNCSIPSGDAGPPYTKCLYDSQLQAELSAYIGSHGLPKGPTQLYFLLLPHRVVTCFEAGECSNNVFCAYHSYIEPGTASEIIYADIPFSLLDTGDAKGCQYDDNGGIQTPNGDTAGTNETTRFADVALKYMSHEYSEAITDPLVAYETAWIDAKGLEIGDKCNAWTSTSESGADAHAFLPTLGGSAADDDLFDQSINSDRYYLQSEWDNATSSCLMKPALTASFDPSPASALVGAQVSFPTTTADPYGNLNLVWSFGDGGTGVGPSPSHAYAASGDYTVTMTATDPLTGAMTPVSHTVIVSEAPAASSTSSPNLLAAGAATTGGSTAIPPNSDFTALANAGVNARTGAITFRLTVGDPGSFSWMLTFKNGQFGAFSAKSTRCKAAHVKINGRCAPAELVFGQGSQAVASPGAVTFTVDPSRSAIRALEDALGQRKGVPVTATLSFQSSHGGLPVSHTQLLSVKLVAMAHQRRSGR